MHHQHLDPRMYKQTLMSGSGPLICPKKAKNPPFDPQGPQYPRSFFFLLRDTRSYTRSTRRRTFSSFQSLGTFGNTMKQNPPSMDFCFQGRIVDGHSDVIQAFFSFSLCLMQDAGNSTPRSLQLRGQIAV